MSEPRIRKIGISTGGGDCPGLNAVIRAVTFTAINTYGWEVVGIRDGLAGLLFLDRIMPLPLDAVRNIIDQGGTILGTTNKGNPFSWDRRRPDGTVEQVDMSQRLLENYEHLRLDAMVMIGGDGSMRIANRLFQMGIPLVGVPKTIDNDLGSTDVTFGFNSAVRTATEALDKLHTTARSHHRVMIVEVMGRESGWIALHSGVAGNAHMILIPEIPFDVGRVTEFLEERSHTPEDYSIVVVAEAAHPVGAEASILSRAADGTPRLGGVGHKLAETLNERTRLECRVNVVGHIQRGGSPTEYDRILATQYGEAACHLLASRKFGEMVSLQGNTVTSVPIAQAVGEPKRVAADGPQVRMARSMGISFGD